MVLIEIIDYDRIKVLHDCTLNINGVNMKCKKGQIIKIF